jgi:hypothetical protein
MKKTPGPERPYKAWNKERATCKTSEFFLSTSRHSVLGKLQDDLPQIRGGQQIGFRRNLRASLNQWEITIHEDVW